jgi:plasmid stabilization system protein ParE
MIIRFTPDADAELAEARQWYSHQRQDLDVEFMERIDDALSRVVSNPDSYPIVYRTLRRVVVRRFPFAVFYEIAGDEIQVIAVFHSRRDPETWKSRVG